MATESPGRGLDHGPLAWGDGTNYRKRIDELERLNADLAQRLTERTRVLTDAAGELAAEIQRREAAQESLLHAQKLELLGQLTSVVAHDFNNALQPILLGYDLLDELIEDASARGIGERGRRSAGRAASLVQSLLACARKQDPRPTLIDPTVLIAEIDDLLQHAVGERIACEFHVDADVWSVIGEVHRIETALVNLAINARDAMPDGGRLFVSVRNVPDGAPRPAKAPPGDYVSFSVRDTGTGMSTEVLARATEAFFTTKGPGRGTGLGLAMVDGCATESGGGVRISSAPGEGTVVEMVLPRAGVQLASHPDETTPAELDRAVGAGQDRHPATPAAAPVLRDRLMERLETAALRDAYAAWLGARAGDSIPRLAQLEPLLAAHADRLFVARVDPLESGGVAFHFLSVGRKLRAELGSPMADRGAASEEAFGTLESAYLRAVRTRAPSYEYARYRFDDGPPVLFERLLLPVSDAGAGVSHLLGVVMLAEQLLPEATERIP